MFGLKKQTAWFFDSSVHLEAVSRLLYLIESGEAFGVISGPDGSGRTRILTRLREEIERTGKLVVSLNVAGLDENAALSELTSACHHLLDAAWPGMNSCRSSAMKWQGEVTAASIRSS